VRDLVTLRDARDYARSCGLRSFSISDVLELVNESPHDIHLREGNSGQVAMFVESRVLRDLIDKELAHAVCIGGPA
jgi:hypothetical protein